MKTISILFLTLSILIAPSFSQDASLNYVADFPTQGDPLAMAADSNGGIYYTVFTFDGPNLTRCYYIADPINGAALDNHLLVDDADDSDVPAGRGFTGVAVDGQGNVFLALEIGSADFATVRKLSPAPDFAPVDAFFSGIVFGGKRYNGVDVMDSSVIALSTFDEVEFWDANDSTPLHIVSGGESFQRDVAYNPNTGDIYVAKNRDVSGEPISSANIVRGGNADDVFAYQPIESAFIPQGGAGGAFGINGQLIEYDAANDWILIPDFSGEQAALAIYNPADTSVPLALLDGAESENGAMDSPADSVAIQDVNGDTWVYVSDNGSARIFVYSTAAPTQVMGWEIY